ncbi:MAG: DUF2207 domain-containing protein [Peptostreptococcaceae bacterium]|nr:DUF2207 domain-containing protein [Peptostreptococcaceae bacterium]
MKKGFVCKSFVAAILLALMIAMSMVSVFAEEKITHIRIDVSIHDDGSADITQVWDVETYKGTEFYITMSNMGDMEVRDLRVTDESGRVFDFVEKWNVKATMEEKAYKCGFDPVDDGFEMCWGKGSHGKHVYTLQYRLTNLVKSYPDYDGSNTRLINDMMSPNVDSATVTVQFADKAKNARLNEEEVGIWAFGYRGTILFEDGKVVAQSDRPIRSSDYMNIMMRFEKGLLDPTSKGEGTFEDLREIAFEGSEYQEKKFGLKHVIFSLLGLGAVGYALILKSSETFLRRPFRRMGGKRKGIGYSRALPMYGALGTTYWALTAVGEKVSNAEILRAYFMKLIRSRAITIRPLPSDDRSTFEMRFDLAVELEDPAAHDLMGILSVPMGVYNSLTEEELKNYFKTEVFHGTHPIDRWIDDLKRNGKFHFRSELEGYKADGSDRWSQMKARLEPKGFELLQQMFDFKKFLKDFTLVSEREVKEVELWDDYLVFATLFGLASKVAKQMKAIDPSFEQRSLLLGEDHRMIGTAATVVTTLYASSAGKGGSSSSGGGGGYSGGGSGGGSR